MSGKSRKRMSYELSMTKAVSNALVIFLWAFVSEFHPETDDFVRLKNEVNSVRDSVLCGALTIPQIRKALKDDYDVEVM